MGEKKRIIFGNQLDGDFEIKIYYSDENQKKTIYIEFFYRLDNYNSSQIINLIFE